MTQTDVNCLTGLITNTLYSKVKDFFLRRFRNTTEKSDNKFPWTKGLAGKAGRHSLGRRSLLWPS
jgi:hypothetical protein